MSLVASSTSCRVSPIVYKVVMAVTGKILVLFLIAHLCGNLLVYAGPEALNKYAIGLRAFPPLLWGARIGLILATLLHIFSAIKLTLLNRSARPDKYARQKSRKASLSSTSMALSGTVILSFAVYHLAHLTFNLTHKAEFAKFTEYDVYPRLILSFSSPLLSAFYSISIILLMMHLAHGIRSYFQTLGINHSRYNCAIGCFAYGLTILLGLGFISIPVAIYFRLIV